MFRSFHVCWNEPEGDTQLSPSPHRPPRVRESSKLCSGGERPSPRVIYSKRSKNTTEISPQISICGMIAAIISLSTGKWRSSGSSALLGGGQGAEFSLLSCNWSQKKTSPSHAMKHLIENLQGENPQYS